MGWVRSHRTKVRLRVPAWPLWRLGGQAAQLLAEDKTAAPVIRRLASATAPPVCHSSESLLRLVRTVRFAGTRRPGGIPGAANSTSG
jgi:hypothetical protein